MDERLSKFLNLCKKTPLLKQKAIKAKDSAEPLIALCGLMNEQGISIAAEELACLGETSCAEMLRSQNGGGEITPDGWDDDFSLFLLLLGD